MKINVLNGGSSWRELDLVQAGAGGVLTLSYRGRL
jgi:hypothetical protein